MTIERPMFPPRADSVHAFRPQPAIGQPESGNLSGESHKPLEGLSRRGMIAGLAVLATALPVAAAEPDPVYAAIERYRRLSIEHTVAVDRSSALEAEDPDYDECDEMTSIACAALFKQMDVIFTFRPSTTAGFVALLKYIAELEDWQMPPGLEEKSSMGAVQTLCASLAAALGQIGGAA